jgi:hypothetical protein
MELMASPSRHAPLPSPNPGWCPIPLPICMISQPNNEGGSQKRDGSMHSASFLIPSYIRSYQPLAPAEAHWALQHECVCIEFFPYLALSILRSMYELTVML